MRDKKYKSLVTEPLKHHDIFYRPDFSNKECGLVMDMNFTCLKEIKFS